MRFPPIVARSMALVVVTTLALLSAASAGSPPVVAQAGAAPKAATLEQFKANIDHLVFVVMENRSFDHYFGTFPGANGIPKKNGKFPCIPDPKGMCKRPYHDTGVFDWGGPHHEAASHVSVNSGKMNGFIRAFYRFKSTCQKAKNKNKRGCRLAREGPSGQPDVMGFHNEKEIPNYWKYARNFVLQDHMFAPTDSWSLPAHLYLVSAWSAKCPGGRTEDCQTRLTRPDQLPDWGRWSPKKGWSDRFKCLKRPECYNMRPFAWADITHLIFKRNQGNPDKVTWAYYVGNGTCIEPKQTPDACKNEGKKATPFIFNPLPGFQTVAGERTMRNVRYHSAYFNAAKAGNLPSVTWIVPSNGNSEHPPQDVRNGQAFATKVINAIMRKRALWSRTAIFLFWDDWGGFYDHVKPPRFVEDNYAHGYGIRVPSILISPWADRGLNVDHGEYSFDSFLRLIEDRFLGGQRLDGSNLDWPDPRPTTREARAGNLLRAFDFQQQPIPRLILDPRPNG